jgi:hypothetical protein
MVKKFNPIFLQLLLDFISCRAQPSRYTKVAEDYLKICGVIVNWRLQPSCSCSRSCHSDEDRINALDLDKISMYDLDLNHIRHPRMLHL